MDNETPSTPQPAPEPPKKQDGRSRNGATFYEHGKKPKKVNAQKLIPDVVKAVLGSKTMTQAVEPLGPDGRRYLSQALKMDVDQWRTEFAGKLRAASEDLLDLTMKEMEQIPPAARAYTLAVLVDKAQALEGKAALSNASVNVQINNFGGVSKEDLIKKLHGQIDELPVQAVEAKE
jgi:hypothetical protein